MKLTNMEMLQVALAMNTRVCSRDTYYSDQSARAFNRVLVKIRKDACERTNCEQILRALGDTVDGD